MSETFDAVEVIRVKRDGEELPTAMIDWVIDAYTRGFVADEQMAALAMAVFLQGLSAREISDWTAAMIASGERMDFSSLPKPTVDKHSTGGVGDMITLVLAPLVACFDVAVPQLSGRGLGHTGGTLDKLESIPGWDPQLSNTEILDILRSGPGAVICAAGAGLAPADKKLYALRDITATVESIPLIASSIMSKKIAEGTGALVLDVKVGSGAFMKDYHRAEQLASTMVDLGIRAGVPTSALLTNMESPLGNSAGNACEVSTALEVLSGGGPADVIELTVALAEEMLRLVGKDADVRAALADGRAMDRWREMIRAQGGDPSAPLPTPRETLTICADESGFISRMDAYSVGLAAWRLGAGRARQGEKVQAAAGVLIHAKPGERVSAGSPLFTLGTDTPERFARASEALAGAVSFSDEEPTVSPVILGHVTSATEESRT